MEGVGVGGGGRVWGVEEVGKERGGEGDCGEGGGD